MQKLRTSVFHHLSTICSIVDTGIIFLGKKKRLPYTTVTYGFAAESPGVLANGRFGMFTLEQ